MILNVANEHTSYGWDDTADVFDFRDPDRIIELCEVVHDVDGDRLVGGWTGNFPRSVFPPEARHAYEEEVERAAARPGLSMFFHNNAWCQTPDLPLRYDLGGQGTTDDPGIRWYFELVRAVRGRADSDLPGGGI